MRTSMQRSIDQSLSCLGIGEWKEMVQSASVYKALELREHAIRQLGDHPESWGHYVDTAEEILFQRGIEF